MRYLNRAIRSGRRSVRFFSGALCLCLIFASFCMMTSCGNGGDATGGTGEPGKIPAHSLVGGWSHSHVLPGALPEELSEKFDEAFRGFVGAKYEPLCLLATRTDAGKYDAVLCRSTVVYPGATPALSVVTVYVNDGGTPSISDISPFSIADIRDSTKAPASPSFGGWEIPAPTALTLTGTAGEAFSEAVGIYEGPAFFTPLAMVGTQVVAGTNYAFVCACARTPGDPPDSVCLVIVYRNVRGQSSVLSVTPLTVTAQ